MWLRHKPFIWFRYTLHWQEGTSFSMIARVTDTPAYPVSTDVTRCVVSPRHARSVAVAFFSFFFHFLFFLVYFFLHLLTLSGVPTTTQPTHHVPFWLFWCGLRFCCAIHDVNHDDVIKWKHFPRYWPFVRGIHRSRWIPRTKASDAELWCFLWSTPG